MNISERVIKMRPVQVKYMLASKEAIQNENNTVNFIEVFDVKELKEIPVKVDFTLIVSLAHKLKKEDSKEITVKIILPINKTKIRDIVIPLVEEGGQGEGKDTTGLSILRLSNFPVDIEGAYSFQLIYEDEMIFGHEVVFRKEGEG